MNARVLSLEPEAAICKPPVLIWTFKPILLAIETLPYHGICSRFGGIRSFVVLARDFVASGTAMVLLPTPLRLCLVASALILVGTFSTVCLTMHAADMQLGANNDTLAM